MSEVERKFLVTVRSTEESGGDLVLPDADDLWDLIAQHEEEINLDIEQITTVPADLKRNGDKLRFLSYIVEDVA